MRRALTAAAALLAALLALSLGGATQPPPQFIGAGNPDNELLVTLNISVPGWPVADIFLTINGARPNPSEWRTPDSATFPYLRGARFVAPAVVAAIFTNGTNPATADQPLVSPNATAAFPFTPAAAGNLIAATLTGTPFGAGSAPSFGSCVAVVSQGGAVFVGSADHARVDRFAVSAAGSLLPTSLPPLGPGLSQMTDLGQSSRFGAACGVITGSYSPILVVGAPGATHNGSGVDTGAVATMNVWGDYVGAPWVLFPPDIGINSTDSAEFGAAVSGWSSSYAMVSLAAGAPGADTLYLLQLVSGGAGVSGWSKINAATEGLAGAISMGSRFGAAVVAVGEASSNSGAQLVAVGAPLHSAAGAVYLLQVVSGGGVLTYSVMTTADGLLQPHHWPGARFGSALAVAKGQVRANSTAPTVFVGAPNAGPSGEGAVFMIQVTQAGVEHANAVVGTVAAAASGFGMGHSLAVHNEGYTRISVVAGAPANASFDGAVAHLAFGSQRPLVDLCGEFLRNSTPRASFDSCVQWNSDRCSCATTYLDHLARYYLICRSAALEVIRVLTTFMGSCKYGTLPQSCVKFLSDEANAPSNYNNCLQVQSPQYCYSSYFQSPLVDTNSQCPGYSALAAAAEPLTPCTPAVADVIQACQTTRGQTWAWTCTSTNLLPGASRCSQGRIFNGQACVPLCLPLTGP